MKKILCFIFIIFCLVGLTGCSKNEQNLENDKTLSEVMYLENGYITIYKKYLKNEYYLDDGSIDWTSINEDFSILSNSVDVILIDFSSAQVKSKDIVQLETNFNDMGTFIDAKDLNGFIHKVCESYNLISYSILDNISEDEEFKLEKKAKSDLLYIGYFLKDNNKDESLNHFANFQDDYSNLSTNKEYIENNSYKINKIFINIQELKSEIDESNFEKAIKTLTEIFEFF